MTTVEANHDFVVKCAGHSSREVYFASCRERNIRCNAFMLYSLDSVPDDFEAQEINASFNYLGPVGVDALVDVVRINKYLIRLVLSNCGVNDANVGALVEALAGHERFGHLDLSGNLDITDECSKPLIDLMNWNKMLASVNFEGTSMSGCVKRKLYSLAKRNEELEANFFKPEYGRLKKLFCTLDTTNSGRISVGALLLQIDIPQVANALTRKFNSIDRGDTFDGFLDINEFLYFTYPDYHTHSFLTLHTSRVDMDQRNVTKNWATLAKILNEARCVLRKAHLVQFFHRELSEAELQRFLVKATEVEWSRQGDPEMTGDGRLLISATSSAQAMEIFGAEVAAVRTQRDREWHHFHLTPEFTIALMAPFVQKNARIDPWDQSLTMSELLAFPVETENLTLQPHALAKQLETQWQVGGPKMVFTFVEWCCAVNENHAFTVLPHFKVNEATLPKALVETVFRFD